MALKLKVKTLDSVPEELRSLYSEEDGEFTLQVEDAAPKQKFDEFRTNNRKLADENERLKKQLAKYGDLDPADIKDAMKAKAELAKKQEEEEIEKGNLEEVVAKRIEVMRTEFEKQMRVKTDALTQIEEERNNLRGRLSTLLIDNTVQQTIGRVGVVRQGAMDDILNRARRVFSVDAAGDMVPNAGGEMHYNGINGEPIKIDEWAQKLLQDAPFLFEPSSGSGSGGGKPKDSATRIKTIPQGDPVAFGQNLEKIAAGEVVVAGTQ